MKIIENNLLPPQGFFAINIFGFMFIRRNTRHRITERTIRHETIHTRQMIELLFIPFYIWYGIEWLIKLPFCWKEARIKYKNQTRLQQGFFAILNKETYFNLSFEREAYANDNDVDYLKNRKLYSFLKYLWKNKI